MKIINLFVFLQFLENIKRKHLNKKQFYRKHSPINLKFFGKQWMLALLITWKKLNFKPSMSIFVFAVICACAYKKYEYFRTDLQVITHHVQNAIDECVKTKNNFNAIVTNYIHVRRKYETDMIEVKSNILVVWSSFPDTVLGNLLWTLLLTFRGNAKQRNASLHVALVISKLSRYKWVNISLIQ